MTCRRTRIRAAALAALLLAALAAGCTRPPPPGVRDIRAYPGAVGRPVGEKISLGTPAILDWQHKINRDYGQDVRPTMAAEGNPLVPLVRAAVAEVPREIRRLAARHVVALYLLENDFGTGTTEAVRDADGNWRYAYIALNLSALHRTANAWGSWKEMTAFRPEPEHEIRMVLEAPQHDTRQAAIRFIFLHELGHALGLGLGAHGWWDAEPLPEATTGSLFVLRSWKPDGEGGMASRWPAAQGWFDRLAFYRPHESGVPLSEADQAYEALEGTTFPSLYGATNLYDDFAEAFAIYVHTRMLGKPYRVEVYREGRKTFTYRSCIETGLCPGKVEVLEQLLGLR